MAAITAAAALVCGAADAPSPSAILLRRRTPK
jgi:hypothetical protein